MRKLSDVEDTFAMIREVRLTTCFKESIPKDFREYYSEELLRDVLLNHWKDEINRD